MKHCIVIALAALIPAAPAQEDSIRRENIEWCDAWMPNMNNHDLPRVVLIGDSITRGYYPAVEQNLKGKAYVARITTSKAVGDPGLLMELATFLSQVKFDVVHFNIGMHGWAYSEDEYRKYFPFLVSVIRKNAPGARLVWASTTPIRQDQESGATNGRIVARNAIALEFARSQAIPIDDLHSFMRPHTDLHTDNVHFSKEGSALMAEKVTNAILAVMPLKPQSGR